MFTADHNWQEWPEEHSKALTELIDAGHSRSEAALELNAKFGTAYTRCACIGRYRRMFGPAGVIANTRKLLSPEERKFQKNKRKREKRWAENPDIIRRYGHEARAKSSRALFLARGATTTSAEYRRHVPRLPKDMSRADLRAMLAQAMQNTAAMVVA